MNKTRINVAQIYEEFVEKYNDFIDSVYARFRDRLCQASLTDEERQTIAELRASSIAVRNNLDLMVEQLRTLAWWDERESSPSRKFQNTTHEKLCRDETINRN